MGVVRANPSDYVDRYGDSLIESRNLPDFVQDIEAPDGLVLAADQEFDFALEGDVEALNLVDLEKEGLCFIVLLFKVNHLLQHNES